MDSPSNCCRGFLQLALLHAIGNPSKPLRHTVGTNVAVIVGVGGLPTWPELLSAFVQCLESNDPNSLEGALDALYKVWAAAGGSGLAIYLAACPAMVFLHVFARFKRGCRPPVRECALVVEFYS